MTWSLTALVLIHFHCIDKGLVFVMQKIQMESLKYSLKNCVVFHRI